MSAASPLQMQPGVVVRLRLGAVVYCSRRMTADDAGQLAKKLREDLAGLARFPTFIEFPAYGYDHVSVRADRVTALEVRSVTADPTAASPARDVAATGVHA